MKTKNLYKVGALALSVSAVCLGISFALFALHGATQGASDDLPFPSAILEKMSNQKGRKYFDESYSPSSTEVERLEVSSISTNIEVAVSPDQRIHILFKGWAHPQMDKHGVPRPFTAKEDGKVADFAFDLSPEDKSWFNLNWSSSRKSKRLITVQIPENSGIKAKTSSGSGDITAEKSLSLKSLEGKTTSGDIQMGFDVENAAFESISGSLDLEAKARTLETKTTSGDLDVTIVDTRLERGQFESISGDVALSVPKSYEPSLEIETQSGEIELSGKDGTKQNSGRNVRFTANQATGILGIKTVSGDVTLKRSKK